MIKKIPIEIAVGTFFILATILLGIWMVDTSNKESAQNIQRAELMLSNTWDAPYEIDVLRNSSDSVVFYSMNKQFEINTWDWTIEGG